MKNRNMILALTVGSLLFASGSLFAEWKVQSGDSKLGFTAFSRMHDADGEFKSWRFEGKIQDNWTGNGKIVIRTESIDTQSAKRDSHLKNEDFFNVAKHPEATYNIEKVEQKGDHLVLSGKLTILGVTKPVTLDLKKTVNGDSAELAGDVMIKRSDFGMNYSSFINPIKDEVKLVFKVVLKKS